VGFFEGSQDLDLGRGSSAFDVAVCKATAGASDLWLGCAEQWGNG